MARYIRRDFDSYELAGRRVKTARVERPCCHPLCGKYGVTIGVGEDYVSPNTGIEFCHIHFFSTDVEERGA